MSDKSYDILIVGASIAGLSSALKLAKNGFSVCVIDKKEKIGLPVRCGEATGNLSELSRFFSVKPEWISCEIKGMSAHINGTIASSRDFDHIGLILNRDTECGFAQLARGRLSI